MLVKAIFSIISPKLLSRGFRPTGILSLSIMPKIIIPPFSFAKDEIDLANCSWSGNSLLYSKFRLSFNLESINFCPFSFLFPSSSVFVAFSPLSGIY
ncbi:MAG: hypothetical protein L6405_08830 [Actinomycetia bacterium]|nr:hypothetical protein [Actinomycetes bacterium]